MKYTKHHISGRGNIYGLCGCQQCRWHRYSFKKEIKRMQKRLRLSWKGGREFIKGLYTD